MRAQHLKLSRNGDAYTLAVEDIPLELSSNELKDVATVRQRLAARSSLTLPCELDADAWTEIVGKMLVGLKSIGVGLWKFQPDPFVKIRAAQELWAQHRIRVPAEEL